MNLIALPSWETIIISASPLVTLTLRSSSPSLKLIAISPLFLKFLNSDKGVFLTNPCLVAMNKYPSSILSLTVNTVSIFSSCSIWIRFIILVPFAVLPASGISYALFLYTLPLLVKNNTSEWVEVTKTCSTKSSSFVDIAWIPLPPLLWAEYVSADILLIYPELVSVITVSSSWIKSSISMSLTTFSIWVLLSSLYLAFISSNSSLITPNNFSSLARIEFK